MAKFAPVVPIDVAEKMSADRILGAYHLLLAHDVVKHPKRYHDVYAGISFGTKIMDNSVIELGKPIDSVMMKVACEIVDANVAVLPDQLLDCTGTIRSTCKALDDWEGTVSDSVARMAVPQGEHAKRWLECCEAFEGIDAITWLGIPRNYKQEFGHSRAEAVMLAHILKPEWNMHLLGFSNDIQDDVITCKTAKVYGIEVKGIDSTVPVRVAMQEQSLLYLSEKDNLPRGDWWDNPGDYNACSEIIASNMQRIDSWIR